MCVLRRQGGRKSPPGPVGVAQRDGPVGGGLRDTYFSPLSSLPPPGLSQGWVHPTGVSARLVVCVCVLGRQGGRESPPGPVGVATQKGPVGGGLRDNKNINILSRLSQGRVHPKGVSARTQTPPAEDGDVCVCVSLEGKEGVKPHRPCWGRYAEWSCGWGITRHRKHKIYPCVCVCPWKARRA